MRNDETPTTADIRAALREVVGDDILRVDDDADLSDALGDAYSSLSAMECIINVEEKSTSRSISFPMTSGIGSPPSRGFSGMCWKSARTLTY
ncbi:MAG: hypothetical protein JO100_18600 [Pseudonocardia sp.]|nr:hypothetical protein [Pseudonocardia sp.]